jgi:uncharacterized protein with FMN-binding domain
MEEVQQIAPQGNNKVILSAVGLVIIVTVGLIAYMRPATTQTSIPSASVIPTTTTQTISKDYKDGVYETVGNYMSPGGEESIEVTLTLVDNVVTKADVVSKAERPNSVKFQGIFVENFEPMVVGRNINEIKLDKVAGSSLTPKGFNDALEKIKAQAGV